jgi:hypothetical protein
MRQDRHRGADCVRYFLILFSFFNSLVGFASHNPSEVCTASLPLPTSREELCERRPKDFRRVACNPGTKLALMNDGGLLGAGTGVCWWNSRFHRNAIYLTSYRPECPALSATDPEGAKRTRRLIERIIRADQLVEIPGYKNLWEWTQAPGVARLLQKELQQWMAKDTFLKQQWVNGVDGLFLNKKGKRARRIQGQEVRKIEALVQRQDKLPFVVLKESGVAAHAWIVLAIERVLAEPASPDLLRRKDTWALTVLDSNHQGRQGGYTGVRDDNGDLIYVPLRSPVETVVSWDGENWYGRDSRVTRSPSPSGHREFPQGHIAMVRYDHENDRLLETLERECRKEPTTAPRCPIF